MGNTIKYDPILYNKTKFMTKMVILEYQKCDADASNAADTDALYTHFSGYGCVIIIMMLIAHQNIMNHLQFSDEKIRAFS